MPLNNPEDDFTSSKARSTKRNAAQKPDKPAKLSGMPLNNPEGEFTNSKARSTNRNDAPSQRIYPSVIRCTNSAYCLVSLNHLTLCFFKVICFILKII